MHEHYDCNQMLLAIHIGSRKLKLSLSHNFVTVVCVTVLRRGFLGVT